MIRLLFIVPYPELEEKVRCVLSQHPERERLDADVQTMTVEDTPDHLAAEYDAIIARGYTAQKTLAGYSQIPTIQLSISGYDLVRAILNAATPITRKRSPSAALAASFTRPDRCAGFSMWMGKSTPPSAMRTWPPRWKRPWPPAVTP